MNKGFGLLFEMGCGKTLTAIAIAGTMYQRGVVKTMLIVAPTSVCSVWPKEFEEFAEFKFMVKVMLGTKQQRLKQLDDLQEQMLGLYKEFVANNIQNIAGQTYLTEFAPAFDDEFVNTELAAIPEAAMTPELQRTKQIYEKKAATAVGQPFKDIVAATPDGGENSVAEVAKNAKVLLIDFWASWCGPCRQEMPHVKAAYEKYHKQGFEIIGVSLDSEADSWKKAIADLGMTWPQISDLQGWDCAGAKAYSVRAIPATVLIKDGKIVARDLRGEKLAEKVEELLK